MRLAQFIVENMEPILKEWEDFAKTLNPAATMNSKELRDHAEEMLRSMAEDLQTPQTGPEQFQKSRGLAPGVDHETAAETHALTRLVDGFTIEQMASEYRALRASVLKHWLRQSEAGGEFIVEDMIRFNEAIDQALAESIASYTKAVNSSRDVFLGMLGHDLRTPLGAILLGSEALLRIEEQDTRATKIASRIFASVKRANKIVNDLLDFTRLQFGPGIPLQLDETNLATICDNMVEEVRAYHPEAKIVYDTRGDLCGQFDSARMEQVFSNLMGNAIQHGDITAPVTVSLQEDQGCAVFAVHNQGEPVPREVISVISNLTSAHTPYTATQRGQGRGLGLGLYIASEIVRAHRGHIEVASEPDLGTVFTARFPLQDEEHVKRL
jgi:signal transduction histidine kinase